jgi:predicted dehydrogenase
MYRPSVKLVPNRTRLAVLGSGYWGINYVRVLNDLPDAEVAVVCDQATSRLDEVARRFPGIPLTDDLQEALAVEDVQAAVVCTQAVTHREVAGLALEAGKHVLVEKPLTTSVSDADELVELADARRRVLLVSHTFVYNPGVRKIKALMRADVLGAVYYLYARRTNLGPIRSDVNAVWDLAPHDVAIFNYLLDAKPQWVSAVGGRVLGRGREDVGFISLGYPDDVVGHIHVSWADPHKVREFVVVGSDARVAFDDLNLVEHVRVFEKGVKAETAEEAQTFGEFHLQVRDGDIKSPTLAVTEPLKEVVGHFLHCVRRGERPRTSGEQGRSVVAVMEAIERSLRQSGGPEVVDAATVDTPSLLSHDAPAR